MRLSSLMMAGLFVAGSVMAQAVDKFAAGRAAEVYNGPRVGVSMWIWSDKYTYQPGQTLTLRWTVKTNNDLYPYTVFVYRQNNQTGEKNYYPAGTPTVTDINGRTEAQGFLPQRLTDRTKAVLLGTGGIAGPVTIPSEFGMHTFVVELRDYNGLRVLKTSYMKIGVVRRTETISGDITTSRTLTNDVEWRLSGLVFVKNNAVLTIEPGTFIVGLPGSQPPSALIITRNATIEARGTAARPIVMTSSQPFGQRQRGDWGGLVMLGKARVNTGAGITAGNPAGEFYIEGLQTTPDGLYGGTDDTHYCGTLTYVRVEFAGSILSPNNELNSFTWGGCGSRTVSHHLQAIYGLDDMFEWFGGTNDVSYFIGGLGADDYVDCQLGYRGRAQFGLFFQSPDQRGNRGIECDNSEYNNLAEPFSNPTFSHMTFIGSGQPGFDEGTAPGLYLRRGTRGSLNNMVFMNFRTGGFHIDDASTEAQANNGLIKVNGLLLWANNTATAQVNTLAGNVPNARGLTFLQGPNATNVIIADPKLTRPFEYSDPDFTAMFDSPLLRTGWVQMPDDGFFDQTARFLGGIGSYDWTEGWTNWLVETDIRP